MNHKTSWNRGWNLFGDPDLWPVVEGTQKQCGSSSHLWRDEGDTGDCVKLTIPLQWTTNINQLFLGSPWFTVDVLTHGDILTLFNKSGGSVEFWCHFTLHSFQKHPKDERYNREICRPALRKQHPTKPKSHPCKSNTNHLGPPGQIQLSGWALLGVIPPSSYPCPLFMLKSC